MAVGVAFRIERHAELLDAAVQLRLPQRRRLDHQMVETFGAVRAALSHGREVEQRRAVRGRRALEHEPMDVVWVQLAHGVQDRLQQLIHSAMPVGVNRTRRRRSGRGRGTGRGACTRSRRGATAARSALETPSPSCMSSETGRGGTTQCHAHIKESVIHTRIVFPAIPLREARWLVRVCAGMFTILVLLGPVG